MSFGASVYYFSLLVVEFMPATLIFYLIAWFLPPKVKIGFLWAILGFFVTSTLSAGASLLAILVFGKESYTPDINNMTPFNITHFGIPLILSIVICLVLKMKIKPSAKGAIHD